MGERAFKDVREKAFGLARQRAPQWIAAGLLLFLAFGLPLVSGSYGQGKAPVLEGRWTLEGDAAHRIFELHQNGHDLTGKALWSDKKSVSFEMSGTISDAGKVTMKVFLDRSDARSDPAVTDELWAAAVDNQSDAGHPGMLALKTPIELTFDVTKHELSGKRPLAKIRHKDKEFEVVNESTVDARLTQSYAERCQAQMGKISSFNCSTGTPLKITLNGHALLNRTTVCDRPVQLTLKAEGQCVRGSRLVQNIPTGHKDVVTTAICRKYHEDKGPADANLYDDVAMISHDSNTGDTCFFQSKVDSAERVKGEGVPSPTDDNADTVWQPRQGTGSNAGPAGVHCIECHSAGPFIWSPYVGQIKDVSENWDPDGKYNSNFADMFGETSVSFYMDKNACTECHRVGNGSNCGLFVRNFTINPKAHVIARHQSDFWMPFPPFPSDESSKAWHKKYDSAIAQIARCCADSRLAECKATKMDGSNP